MQRVEPPLAVIDAFNDVQRARADQERARNEAEAYANDILPRARGEAERIRQDAEAYRTQVVNLAQGEADAFLPLLQSYEQAKDVTAWRLYLDSVDEVLSKASKVILDTSGKGVVERRALHAGHRVQGRRPRPVAARRRRRAGSGRNEERLARRRRRARARARSSRSSSLYVVGEGEQALVVRLGAPVGVVETPGLKFKAPFIDSVYVPRHALAAARAADRAGDPGRPEAARGAALHALPHRRSAALLSGAAHARRGPRQLAQLVSSSVRRELGQVAACAPC